MKTVAALLGVLLVGCASQPTDTRTWQKEGATREAFRQDQGQCQAQAYSVPNAPLIQIGAVYNACMRGKGWELRPVAPSQ